MNNKEYKIGIKAGKSGNYVLDTIQKILMPFTSKEGIMFSKGYEYGRKFRHGPDNKYKQN